MTRNSDTLPLSDVCISDKKMGMVELEIKEHTTVNDLFPMLMHDIFVMKHFEV